MARYDRIAPLAAPSREDAFPAWGVLRDLEGRDRDNDLARRARLRFLALRPIRRLLDRGLANVGRDSYLAQIEAAREELGYLPARDFERARLARYLHHIEDRDPVRLIVATLEIADSCATAGQTYGAEEYALTAYSLAALGSDYPLQAHASITLARIYRVRQEWDNADAYARRAIAVAQRGGMREDLVRARAELALCAAARGEQDIARDILRETLADVRASGDLQGEALAHAKLCAVELAAGNATAALEYGWPALRYLDDVRERVQLLDAIGSAFAAAGLHTAAERCFTLLAQRGSDGAARARARAAQAVQAAASGGAQLFRERRHALLENTPDWAADARAAAFVHLELGRGCVLVRDFDFAREHLRAAISGARAHGFADILASAEGVLSVLENSSAVDSASVATNGPAASARRIAEQLDSLPEFSPAGG